VESYSFTKKKLLLIDSNKEHAMALSTYLERKELEVTIVDKEEEVAVYIRSFIPLIIIFDTNITEKANIEEILIRLKKDYPYTQLIIMTEAINMTEAMKRLHQYAAYFITKPISSIALEHALKQALDLIQLNQKMIRYTQRLEELQYAQILCQQLFDEVPCYISVQDKNFRVTTTNEMFKRDFSYNIGSYCFEIYKHRNTPCPNCPVAATFEDGLNHETEEVVTSKSGEHYNVVTWTAPIRDENGNITQVMEMSTNITQIRKLQDHLTSLGLMLGSMSHGVKGMLTALDGSIYKLETGIKSHDNERIEECFRAD
jgi:CheY-like chemotaxis protein